jgi:hypothetical protein
MSRASKQKLLDSLRQLVRESLRLREEGTTGPKLSHVLGMIDGSMRVLLDAELASRTELLDLVSEERTRSLGPAVGVLEPPSYQAA